MHTAESPAEELQKKMLRELNGLLTYYRWLIFAGIIIGCWLLLAALSLIGAGWLKFVIGWLGCSIIGATCWIYCYAYRGARQELMFFRQILGVRKETRPGTILKYCEAFWRLCSSGYFQAFLGGLLIALLVATSLQDKYEDRFFKTLSRQITWNDRALPEDTLLVRAMGVCHKMLQARSLIFTNTTETSLVDTYIHPLSTDLISADGSCGSYSSVMGRLLQAMGYRIRFVQMKVGKEYGGHILIEVLAVHGWVVLDPLYNCYFQRPDGRLASFADVAGDWPYYRRQTPPGYDPRYRYEGVRYTNWTKIPVILPLAKKIFGLFMDQDGLQHFSLRVYLLRKYLLLKYLVLTLLILLSAAVARKITRRIAARSRPAGGPIGQHASTSFPSSGNKIPYLFLHGQVDSGLHTWAIREN